MLSRSSRVLPTLAVLPLFMIAACSGTATPEPGATSDSAPASGSAPVSESAPASPPAGTSSGDSSPSVGTSGSATTEATTEPNLSIEITLADGKVTPNGEKFDAKVGDVLELTITSDHDDEIHIHGVELEVSVKAGEPVTQQVTLSSPGSYEIESHHPAKTIGVLNVR